MHIPANVTADSGIVTGIPVNVTGGSVLRVLILCRLACPAVLLSWYGVFYQFIGPCQAAGGAPPRIESAHLTGLPWAGGLFLRSDSPVSVKR